MTKRRSLKLFHSRKSENSWSTGGKECQNCGCYYSYAKEPIRLLYTKL